MKRPLAFGTEDSEALPSIRKHIDSESGEPCEGLGC